MVSGAFNSRSEPVRFSKTKVLENNCLSIGILRFRSLNLLLLHLRKKLSRQQQVQTFLSILTFDKFADSKFKFPTKVRNAFSQKIGSYTIQLCIQRNVLPIHILKRRRINFYIFERSELFRTDGPIFISTNGFSPKK